MKKNNIKFSYNSDLKTKNFVFFKSLVSTLIGVCKHYKLE